MYMSSVRWSGILKFTALKGPTFGTNFRKNARIRVPRPGLGTRILAFFLKLVPKVGPFKAVNFKIPDQRTEDMYIKSVDQTVEEYARLLGEVRSGKLELPNRDFDTGRDTRAGEYALTDKTYAQLVDDLSNKSPNPLPPGLRQNVLQFYSDMNAPIATKKNAKAWQKLQDELDKLKVQSAGQHEDERPVVVRGKSDAEKR